MRENNINPGMETQATTERPAGLTGPQDQGQNQDQDQDQGQGPGGLSFQGEPDARGRGQSVQPAVLPGLRVLHVLDHSIPLHSGYSFRTAAILRAQRALGWTTYHLTSPKQGHSEKPTEMVGDLDFFRTLYDPRQRRGIKELGLMRALARRLTEVACSIRPDVLHAHSPVLNAIPTLWVGRKLDIPVVYEIRAFWEDAAVDHGTAESGDVRYRATRNLETLAIRRADHVTTICEGLRNDIIARGISGKKVTVIPNAVDIRAFSMRPLSSPSDGNPLRRKLGLEGCRILGFIGSFYAYEGLDLLIQALPQILTTAPDVRVLMVGGGSAEATWRAEAEKIGVADKMIFTGRVPHSEVSSYYDIVDLLIYPRHSIRLTELVTPLKPLEAMAQGKILVASNVGGHQELIRDGVTGYLFKAGSSHALAQRVLEALAHPEAWPAMAIAGRNFVETERNWDASVRRYGRVYDSVLRGR